jgi:hypothetical protein
MIRTVEIAAQASGQPVDSELPAIPIFRFDKPVRKQQDAIAWRKRGGSGVVMCSRQQAESRSASIRAAAQDLDMIILAADLERIRMSRPSETQLSSFRIQRAINGRDEQYRARLLKNICEFGI